MPFYAERSNKPTARCKVLRDPDLLSGLATERVGPLAARNNLERASEERNN